MVTLTRDTVEEWLKDCSAFCHAFQRYSFEWHHAIGADIDILAEQLAAVHAEWVAQVIEWQTKGFKQETASLSYTKIFAILLSELSKSSYIGEMREYAAFRRQAPEFKGTEDQRIEMLADLLGAPEAVTALQFCLAVLNFYEAKRVDRVTPFQFRMTESGRHDLLVMITTRENDATAIYMALEGFYARD